MDGGVEGEHEAKHDQADHEHGRRVSVGGQRDRDTGRQDCEKKGQPGGRKSGRLAARAPQELRREGLHDAVADHPDRHKAADLPEAPIQHAAQVDRQADDEPDVARREQKDARGGE